MQRPRFSRWIKREIMRMFDAESFNIRKFAAKVQRIKRDGGAYETKAAALLLYAHENGNVSYLCNFLWDEDMRREFMRIDAKLGNRSVEKLALRGTPMMSLPVEYREIIEAYSQAYRAPERIGEEKRKIWEETHQLQLETGMSSAEISRALDLDRANTNAYLKNGDLGRFTLETAESILALLQVEEKNLRDDVYQ